MLPISKVSGLVFGAIGCIGIGAMIGGATNVRWNGELQISSVDFLTLVLSSLSVMLAVLTIFLAVFAFIGWSSINERLREHSMNYFTNELKEGKPSFELLRTVVRGIVYEGIQPAEANEIFPDEEDRMAEAADG